MTKSFKSLGLAPLLGLLAAGCAVTPVSARCPECSVARAPSAVVPAAPRLVVLVHGAFGFGAEWDPIVAALRRSPELPFVVFAWDGPFRDLSPTVQGLTALLQDALDRAPAGGEVLVLAHSAGGPIATRAVRGLRVESGRHVLLADVAAPSIVNGRPFFRDRLDGLPSVPPGVTRTEFLTEDSPLFPPVDDPRRVYLGASTGHNEALGLASLPLLTRWTSR